MLSLLLTSEDDMADSFGPRIAFLINDISDSEQTIAKIAAIRDSADNEGAIIFRAGTDGNEEFVRIDHNGNVGIGKTSGGAKLDVAGYGDFNNCARIGENANSHLKDIGNAAGNLHLDARSGVAEGAIYLNYNNGNGGVRICNGAGVTVATISAAGKGSFKSLEISGEDVDATAIEINKAADGIGVTIPRQKVVEIGDWNMDTTSTVIVTHGLPVSKILGARGIIRNDTDTLRYCIGCINTADQYPDSAIGQIADGGLVVGRRVGGFFDTANYDSTSYNRGWIIVDYFD